jgi:sugar phosphate isomerase/epimerase
MPPGWGEIPYDEVFSFLSTPPVVLLLEIRPRYMDQFKEVLKEARRLASLASSNE